MPAACAQALTFHGALAARSGSSSAAEPERVAQPQPGQSPRLGHRAQHQQVAALQQLRRPLRRGQQIAIRFVQHKQRLALPCHQCGKRLRRRRLAGGIIRRAEPAKPGARGSDTLLQGADVQRVRRGRANSSMRPPARCVATAYSPKVGANDRVASPALSASCAMRRISSVLPFPTTTCAGERP